MGEELLSNKVTFSRFQSAPPAPEYFPPIRGALQSSDFGAYSRSHLQASIRVDYNPEETT